MGRKNDQNTDGQTTGAESGEQVGAETEAKPCADLEARLAQLQDEKEAAEEKYRRSLADFQNFQRRAIRNEEEARRQGAAGVLHAVIRALDHFDQALQQPAANLTPEQARAGLELIRGELLRSIEQQGASLIRPEPNSEFTPGTHEAIAQMPREGIEPGRVVEVYQAGYMYDDRVLRPAKVVVAPAAETQEEDNPHEPRDNDSREQEQG